MNNSSNIECLKGNLQTLYAAAHGPEEEPMVIGDWDGKNLLLKGVGLSSWFWSQVYDGAICACQYTLEDEKRHAALLFTHAIFSEEQQRAIDAQFDYQNALQMLIRNEQVPDERLRRARNTLTAWHSATIQWTKFLKLTDSENIENWLNEYSDSALQKPYFFSEEILQKSDQLRRFFKIITVEGHLRTTFAPLLFKTACSQPLSKQEKKNLQALVRKINQSKTLGVRIFDKVLRLLIEIFKNENDSASLVAMKVALIFDAKCTIFIQKDVKHCLWRNTLEPGSEVFWGDKKLTLGKQLGEKKDPAEDRNRVFTVVEDAFIVLSFGINRALHDLRKEMCKKYSWGLRSAKCIGVDMKGRFAVIQRLNSPLADIQWKSQKELVKEDEKIVQQITNLIANLLKRKAMLRDFSVDNFMCNEMGCLRYLKLPLKGPIKFDELVRFVIRCAGGNPVIYKALSAQLKEHPYAAFYEKMVKNALKDIPDDPSDFADIQGGNIKIVDLPKKQGVSLHEEVIDLKEACLQEIEMTYGHRKDLPELVNGAILSCYMNGGHIGILPESFSDEVMKLVKRKL